MDITLDEEIKRTESQLEKLWKKDPNAVFHCPKCGEYFLNLANYDQLKMCGKCYTREKTKELQNLTKKLLGATILKVHVEKADPMYPDAENPLIKSLTVRTKSGEIVKLSEKERIAMIL
jgi:ribosomal protein S27AE